MKLWPCLSACRNAEKWIFIREPGAHKWRAEGWREISGGRKKFSARERETEMEIGIKIKRGAAKGGGGGGVSLAVKQNDIEYGLRVWKGERESMLPKT